ncbi:AmmeMemoRadiSam system protein B [Borrelia sp. A-FGy1]|uniref:AmmeMemoRadiSam system protein B n=1 Tax=Borrelia sp. A-FGy1 TaxID=2608247 RepID=UPI0015F40EA1|nr:AmmeMemoRadiSam system protein B [Borrelia sp. A-FGy1]QMU99138.1 AmmeMemoRadiSam system protein B [Borrelia sp. A-FGy1]
MHKRKTHKALLVSYGNYEFFLQHIHLFQRIIDKNTKNIFIFSQTKKNSQINISTHKSWKIFNSKIYVNVNIMNLIQKLEFTNTEDKIIENDHKIEIVLNFIKDMTKNIKIIPIILGKLKYQILKEFCQFLNPFTEREENSFLFLSHFISQSTNLSKAIKLASTLKELLVKNNLNTFLILENYNAHKIFPENINAFIITHKLFQRFEFKYNEIIKNNNAYLIIENILIN